jgi:hypothetical protein
MKELSPEARAIVEVGRDGDRPSRGDRTRVRKALSRTLAAGTFGAATTAASTAAGKTAAVSAAKGASLAGVAAKTIAGIALVGIAGAGVWFGLHWTGAPAGDPADSAAPRLPEISPRLPDPPRPIPQEAPVNPSEPPVAAMPHAATAAPVPLPAPDRNRPAREAPEPTASRPTSPPSTLEAETRLLREAHDALQAGQPGRALDLLDQQSQAYAGGQLGEERAAARVLALCKAGRPAEAQAAATRFLAEHPHSPLADRVRSSCSAEPAAAPPP